MFLLLNLGGGINVVYHVHCCYVLVVYALFQCILSVQIKLYDHRQIQKGPVQSYEGNVNSHTRIELGVDPSERVVMSG